MRYILLTFIIILFGLAPLGSQELPSFININTEGATIRTSSLFQGVAVYGDNFVVLQNESTADSPDLRANITVVDENAEIVETIIADNYGDVAWAQISSSADGQTVWLAGNTIVTDQPGNNSDVSVLSIDINGNIDNGLIDDQRFDNLQRIVGADDGRMVMALVSSNSIGFVDSFSILLINEDFETMATYRLAINAGESIGSLRFSPVGNAVYVTFDGSGTDIGVAYVNFTTDEVYRFTIPELPVCDNGSTQRLYELTSNVSQTEDVLVMVTSCLNFVSFYGSEGEAAYAENQGVPMDVISSFTNNLLVFTNEDTDTDEIRIFQGNLYTDIMRSSSGEYTFIDQQAYSNDVSFNSSSRGAVRKEDGFIISFQGERPLRLQIISEPQNNGGEWGATDVMPIEQIPGFSSGAITYSIERAGIDLVSYSFQNQGFERNLIRTHDDAGNVMSEFTVPSDNPTSEPVGLPNGNFAVARSVDNGFGEDTDVTVGNYNQNGLVSELFTYQTQSILLAAPQRQRLERADNGDFVALHNYFDQQSFDPLDELIRFTATGNEIYRITMPDSLTARFEIANLALDEDGNTYVIYGFGRLNVRSYDAGGNLRFATQADVSANFGSLLGTTFSPEGNLVISGILNRGTISEPYLYEIDGVTGEEIAISYPAPELETIFFQAKYVPNTDTLAASHYYYAGPGSPVATQFRNRVLLLDEQGVFYDQVNYSTQQEFLRAQSVSTDQENNFYTVGAVDQIDFNDFYPVIIGVNVTGFPNQVADLPEVAGLQIFPTLTQGVVNLNWAQKRSGSYRIQVFSATGQLAAFAYGEAGSKRTNTSIDLHHLATGTYLLRLETEEGVSTQRIVKQ